MPIRDFEKAKRLIEQIEPVVKAAEKLRVSHAKGLKEPPGHPNMHPVRAAMKELQAELERAVGEIARSRREDDLERQRRQSRHKNNSPFK
jgi:hypothetical protein